MEIVAWILAGIALGYLILAVGCILERMCAEKEPLSDEKVRKINAALRRQGLDPKKAWKHGGDVHYEQEPGAGEEA